ncbi:unnamed protein product [Nesidiocoris tenuis]|uniref:Uncharacterized protein n=1 Tax=Nesidiocoris tenuis TaxID=355587 RepID=A0A6H5H333_9HEMI|nr:unnamed protein product [Nesidiocoris tenuis]
MAFFEKKFLVLAFGSLWSPNTNCLGTKRARVRGELTSPFPPSEHRSRTKIRQCSGGGSGHGEPSRAESSCSRMLSLVPALVGIWTNHQRDSGLEARPVETGTFRVREHPQTSLGASTKVFKSSPKVRICGSTNERSQTTVRSRMLRRWKRSRSAKEIVFLRSIPLATMNFTGRSILNKN